MVHVKINRNKIYFIVSNYWLILTTRRSLRKDEVTYIVIAVGQSRANGEAGGGDAGLAPSTALSTVRNTSRACNLCKQRTRHYSTVPLPCTQPTCELTCKGELSSTWFTLSSVEGDEEFKSTFSATLSLLYVFCIDQPYLIYYTWVTSTNYLRSLA